ASPSSPPGGPPSSGWPAPGRRRRSRAPRRPRRRSPFERGPRRAVERLSPTPGDRILLVGCGTGLDLEHMPDGASITAIDVVPENVRRTAERAEALDLGVETRVADAEDLPFADGSFDAVALHLLLAVVPDPEAVLAETARVLATDGCVSVFDKLVPEGTTPSLGRRAVNPIARLLFSDVTRKLEPMVAGTSLTVWAREWVLGGFYSVATLEPAERSPERRRRAEASA
ncbi:SAM-dependent methyltransferase, partial [Halobacteriales archaeon SW_12_69_24]